MDDNTVFLATGMPFLFLWMADDRSIAKHIAPHVAGIIFQIQDHLPPTVRAWCPFGGYSVLTA